MCTVLDVKYPRQPVLVCAAFAARDPDDAPSR
jgi:hypothetical protein